LQRSPAARPTAICCSGDWMACAVLQVASELGLRVPRDVSVIGFADMTATQFVQPPLTTIQQPFSDMGRLAVRRLLSECEADLSANDGQSDVKPSRQSVGAEGEILNLLSTYLIERGSTARAPTINQSTNRQPALKHFSHS
jgi:DNA-binding LacI/PurR family transcriptional regulator